MGRTVPSYRMALEREIDSWKPMKKALQPDEWPIFENMMDLARMRASVDGAAVRSSITEAMLMAINFYQHKIIKEIEKKLNSRCNSNLDGN